MMKSFIFKLFIVFVLLFVIDRIAGVILDKWLHNVTTSTLGKDNYICDHCTEEILVFGSSRAELHYNAKLIEDSLNMTTYNCGASGYGIILSYGRLLMISERYHPKLIIMEITPEFDLIEYMSNQKELGQLKRYYDRKGIREIFENIDYTEKYKMMSYLYRYNSDIMHNPLRLLKNIPFTKNALGVQGFKTDDELFDPMKINKSNKNKIFKVDSIKIKYLNNFLDLATKTSRVVFVISPYWNEINTKVFEPAYKIAKERNIPLIDYSCSLKFLHHNEYFKDGVHLNAKGADLFTCELIKELKNLYIFN